MSDPFLNSLYNKCTPSPWHQGIFLSQKIINESFANMWAIAEESSPIRSFKIDTGAASLDAKMKAPTVIVNVVDNGFTLYMQMNFQEGQLKVSKTFGPKGPFEVFDVKNWQVAFGSMFEREEITPENPLFPKYVKEIGLPPQSKFSLAQLYLKALESPTYYPEGSNFQGVDWAKQSAAVQTNFGYLRWAWMASMTEQGQTNVSVALTTNDPSSVNKYAPTFPPTSIDWVTYPWKNPFQPNSPANTYPANALSYLIMTDKVKGPVPPTIPYTGTWVTTDISDPNRDAIFCMDNHQFWDQWFLPKLQVANRAIQMQPTTPRLEWDSKIKGTFYWAPRLQVGTCTAHPDANDAYYKWTKKDDGSWRWDADPSLLKSETDIDSTLNHIWFKEEAWANGTISFDKAGNTISVENQSHFWGQIDVGKDGWKGWFKMEWYITSKMKFIAQRVDDGGMQLIPLGSPEVIKSTPWHDGYLMSMSDDVAQYIQRRQDEAVEAFRFQQNGYYVALVQGFQNQNKLVLPGAGDYLFSNVAFNGKGDLIANLAFNGAAPPGQTRPKHPLLEGLPARRLPEEFMQPEPGPPPPPMIFRCVPTEKHKISPATIQVQEITPITAST